MKQITFNKNTKREKTRKNEMIFHLFNEYFLLFIRANSNCKRPLLLQVSYLSHLITSTKLPIDTEGPNRAYKAILRTTRQQIEPVISKLSQ